MFILSCGHARFRHFGVWVKDVSHNARVIRVQAKRKRRNSNFDKKENYEEGGDGVVVAAPRPRKRSVQLGGPVEPVQIQHLDSDGWRLDSVVDAIKAGGVGIIPTDTYPALVCDLANKEATLRLYEAKGASPKKQLSILVRNMSDIAFYTQGFPVEPNFYKIAKRILPGPYTLIMNASKEVPKQVIDFESGKKKKRSTIGIRYPGNAIAATILRELDYPLLCSSATMTVESSSSSGSVPRGAADMATLVDLYNRNGALSFAVEDLGHGVDIPKATENMGSTIIDLSGAEIEILRFGKGETESWWDNVAF